MQKLEKVINYTALATEASHIFCCVLPTIFSLLSLLVGLGVIGAVPPGIDFMHDLIHDWEIPIIIASGLVIFVGWLLHDYAQKIDCESMGPDHEICAPRKKSAEKILKIATFLFVVNVSIYFLVHRPMDEHHGHDHSAHEVTQTNSHAAHDHNHAH